VERLGWKFLRGLFAGRATGFWRAEDGAFEKKINRAAHPPNARFGSFGGIEPFDEMAAVAGREIFESLPCFEMFF
jgi:hypothetical protein